MNKNWKKLTERELELIRGGQSGNSGGSGHGVTTLLIAVLDHVVAFIDMLIADLSGAGSGSSGGSGGSGGGGGTGPSA